MHMFRVLISVEVRHLKKFSRFILKMPNCGVVGCTVCSTKNPNLSFHENVVSGNKVLRGKNSFLRSFLHICSEKDCFEDDLIVNTILVFLCAVTAAVIQRRSLKKFPRFSFKILKKAHKVRQFFDF